MEGMFIQVPVTRDPGSGEVYRNRRAHAIKIHLAVEIALIGGGKDREERHKKSRPAWPMADGKIGL